MKTENTEPRRPDAVLAFVERFASALVDAGMPRMPALVFVALLSTDAGGSPPTSWPASCTSARAAVSGAVRYLSQVGMLRRERHRGSRRERTSSTTPGTRRRAPRAPAGALGATAREGVAALGPDTPAGARMVETVAFFEFLRREMAALQERWRRERLSGR